MRETAKSVDFQTKQCSSGLIPSQSKRRNESPNHRTGVSGDCRWSVVDSRPISFRFASVETSVLVPLRTTLPGSKLRKSVLRRRNGIGAGMELRRRRGYSRDGAKVYWLRIDPLTESDPYKQKLEDHRTV